MTLRHLDLMIVEQNFQWVTIQSISQIISSHWDLSMKPSFSLLVLNSLSNGELSPMCHGVVPNYDFIFSSYETTTSVQMTTDIIHDDEEDELIVDPDGQGGFGSGVLQGISLHFYGEGSFTSLFDLNFYDGLFETNLGNSAEIQIGKQVSFQIDMNSPSKVCKLNVGSQFTVFENERSLAKYMRYLHQSPHKTTLQVVTYDSSILE